MNKFYCLFLCFSSFLFFLISCGPAEESDCNFKRCKDGGFTIVDAATYENLIGVDKYVHPDSLLILNARGDTMYHEIYDYQNGWYQVTHFSPWQEIYCFNLCLLDSAFVRRYYLYLGRQDWDTLDIHFETHQPDYYMYFNGESGATPEDKPEESPSYGYWFSKKLPN